MQSIRHPIQFGEDGSSGYFVSLLTDTLTNEGFHLISLTNMIDILCNKVTLGYALLLFENIGFVFICFICITYPNTLFDTLFFFQSVWLSGWLSDNNSDGQLSRRNRSVNAIIKLSILE